MQVLSNLEDFVFAAFLMAVLADWEQIFLYVMYSCMYAS